ncbi:MAG: serine/threonine protein kinase [Bryobacterales bacterium]|nr:serine/threonine protein kinase [Bryobacterales bacterium]
MKAILDWQTLQQVFFEALEVGSPDRARFLDERCAGDPALRRQAESLLLALDEADPLFAPMPVNQALAEALAEQPPPPEQIGAYRILSLLGRGGMGAVYLAERTDEEFQLRVAVKVIGAAMTDAAVRLRFRVERQILAKLAHPNIARLLDGGTTPAGTPYIVMEYVDGVAINAYCARPEVTETQKLQLFRQICSAVQAAHQNLVIHRDIKPGNILVTADGVPKLLDFGIAKLLDPGATGVTAAATRAYERLMTPEYASPEQFGGEAITTASDVDSLGALLYELLASAAPFAFSGLSVAEMERRVSTTSPQPLAGDAGRVIEKAMHRDPLRRYASAQELADDVTRLLEGRPVTARPDSSRYRLHMWMRRNRALAGALGLLSVTALLLVVSLAVGLSATQRAQLRAERRFAEVRSLASHFLFEVHDAIRDLPGSTAARKLLVERAIRSFQSLEAEAGDDVPFRIDLARGWQQVARIQHSSGEAHLGDAKAAVASLERSLALLEPLYRQDPRNRQALALLVEAKKARLSILEDEGSAPAAKTIENRRELLALIEPWYRADRQDREIGKMMASALYGLSSSLLQAGDLQAGIAQAAETEQVYRALVARFPDDADLQLALSLTLSMQGDKLGAAFTPVNLGRNEEALKRYLEAGAIRRVLRDRYPDNQLYQRLYIGALNDQAALREVMGQVEESVRLAGIVVRESRAIRDSDPLNAEAARDYATMLNNLGDVQITAKRFQEAEQSLREALRLREEYRARFTQSRQGTVDVASTLSYLGRLMTASARPAEAAEAYRRSIAEREKVLSASDSELISKQAEAWEGLGKSYQALRSAACAEAFAKAAEMAELLKRESAGLRASAAACQPRR